MNAQTRLLGFKVNAAEWWDALSDELKQDYVKEHPNSKYAKEYIKKHKDFKLKHSQSDDDDFDLEDDDEDSIFKTRTHKSPYRSRPSLTHRHSSQPRRIGFDFDEDDDDDDDDDDDYFSRPKKKKIKEDRSTLGKSLKADAKSISKKAIKDVGSGLGGLVTVHKVLQGHSLSKKDYKSLGSTVLNLCGWLATTALVGGTGGTGLLIFGALKWAVAPMTKSIISGLAKKKKAQQKSNGKGIIQTYVKEDMVEDLLNEIAQYIENGDIPRDAWEKAMEYVRSDDIPKE